MKKFLLILIISVLVGIFSTTFTAHASTDNPYETCRIDDTGGPVNAPCIPPAGSTDKNPFVNQNYQFLAPLPGLKDFNPEQPNALGNYLNIVIKLAIGLAAVLAMVMIVMGGIQYMTSELVHSKEEGKKRIGNAILGLLIALGAYLILFTINPDLLDTTIKIDRTTLEYSLAEAIPSDTGAPPGATSKCTAGIQKTIINMFACGSILPYVNSMLTVAKSSGLNITGGGYRTVEQQKELRIKHCNGDVTNANAPCVPPTALPGQSNHNNGLAFDLQCDGVFIQTSDNKCFVWLKAHASTYGFYNLPSEPWHWSTDGR